LGLNLGIGSQNNFLKNMQSSMHFFKMSLGGIYKILEITGLSAGMDSFRCVGLLEERSGN
jgi:hypothetical protein